MVKYGNKKNMADFVLAIPANLYYKCPHISESELVMTYLLAAIHLYNVLSLNNALCLEASDEAFNKA